ncbi:hypothetical protein V8F20_003614 [Naviculisporaceae sp. PSN 640]
MSPLPYSSPGRLPGRYTQSTYNLALDRGTGRETSIKTSDTNNDLPDTLTISKPLENEAEREENEDDTPRAARAEGAGRNRSVSPSLSQFSVGSEHSNVSMDSLPEPLGGERPLTIPKRRDNHASRGIQGQRRDTFGNNPNTHNENGRQEQEITDMMASLGRMTLNDRVQEIKGESIYGTRTGSPMTNLQSVQSRTSNIPRAQPKLSNRPSLMFLDRKYHGSGSMSTYSCYSDTHIDARPGLSRIPQRSSPNPSLGSTPSVSSAPVEAYDSSRSVRNSPYLRSAKSMHHMATTAHPIHGYDGELSLSPPIPAASPGGLSVDGSGGDGDRSRDYSASSRQSSFDDPYILVPRIIVTPETKLLEDGATGLWAAVQISALIRPANSAGYQDEDGQIVRGPSQLDSFRYGCLYNVSVEVLGTENSVVVELLDDKLFALNTTLYPGSRLLIMAHVKLLNHSSASNGSVHGLRHVRQSSDDLIQDLEHHLGNKHVEYLQIRIRYHHSSFPQHKQDQTSDSDGILDVDTSIETVARAAIKQHNSSSLWSPRPAIQQNPLFEIIASHWGPTSAGEIMQRIINSHRMTHHGAERKLTPMHVRSSPVVRSRPVSREYCVSKFSPVKEGSEETLKTVTVPAPTRMPPPIPRRQASLNCPTPKTASAEQLQTPGTQARDTTPSKKTVVWSELRRTSLTDQATQPAADSDERTERVAFQTPTQAHTLRGTRSLNQGTLRPGYTDSRQQGGDSNDHRNGGDYFRPPAATASPKAGGPMVTEWGATIRTGTVGRSSKRGSNEMVDDEKRATRRQKMLFMDQQAATISAVGRGNGNSTKRGSMGIGTLPPGGSGRGGAGAGAGTLDSHQGFRRYRQPQIQPSLSGGELYRGSEEHSLASLGGDGQRGVAGHGGDGGGIYTDRYGTKGKNEKSGTTRGTATGRWGWTGWWP